MMEQASFAPALQQLAVQQQAAIAASLATQLSQLQRGRAPTARHVSVKSYSAQTFNSGSGSGNGLNTYSVHPDIITYNDDDLDTHIQELRHSIRTRSRYYASTIVAKSQESDAATPRS